MKGCLDKEKSKSHRYGGTNGNRQVVVDLEREQFHQSTGDRAEEGHPPIIQNRPGQGKGHQKEREGPFQGTPEYLVTAKILSAHLSGRIAQGKEQHSGDRHLLGEKQRHHEKGKGEVSRARVTSFFGAADQERESLHHSRIEIAVAKPKKIQRKERNEHGRRHGRHVNAGS